MVHPRPRAGWSGELCEWCWSQPVEFQFNPNKGIIMQATALICTEQQQFSLESFDIPALTPSQIHVRTLFSGVSVGTEFANGAI